MTDQISTSSGLLQRKLSIIKQDLEQCCKCANIKSVLMVHDVATRWNSTAALIKRGIELKAALQILVVMGEYNKP